MSILARLQSWADQKVAEIRSTEAAYPFAAAFEANNAERIRVVEEAIAAASEPNADRERVWNPTVTAMLASLMTMEQDVGSELHQRLWATIEANRALCKVIGSRMRNQALKEALHQMRSAESVSKHDGPIVDPNDMVGMAKAMLDWLGVIGEHHLVAFWQGDWFIYDDVIGYYRRTPPEVAAQLAQNFLVAARSKSDDGKLIPAHNGAREVKELLATLASLVLVQTPSVPVEIDASRRVVGTLRRLCKFENLAVDFDAIDRGDLQPYVMSTPTLFITNSLPVKFDPDATAPMFTQFLREICTDENGSFDIEMHDGLLLLVAYIVSGDMDLQAVFLFVGVPGSGKGTFIRILTALVGSENVNSTNLSQLIDGQFALSALLGKTLAVGTDSHSSGGNGGKISEILVTISGQDGITVNRKGLPLLTNVRLFTRFIILMNEMMPLPDKAGALRRRLIAYFFRKTFVGAEKSNLAEVIIADELPGIARMAIEAYRRMAVIRREARQSGVSEIAAVRAAMQPSSGRGLVDKMSELGAPIRTFIEDCMILDPDGKVAVKDVYFSYDQWCMENGHHAAGKIKFASDLCAAFPEVKEYRDKPDDNGRRERCLLGLSFTSAEALRRVDDRRDAARWEAWLRSCLAVRFPPELEELLSEGMLRSVPPDSVDFGGVA